MCRVYGESAVSRQTAANWFRRFFFFDRQEACENHLSRFFAQKPQKFYTDGIMVLPEKWQKVVDQNGTYLV
ncbi:hypothetical protein WH47_10444 [Habropoda laboriosa]|uniref:Mos1 transposase HTH domain-containing protein n=1 Tax=Habropoda laboriosa TaxID=597456 RepID=A0A0L7QMI4_9HYME|nr:hypothetical protein WH47_10444 [Habropoda laboriosa]